MRSILQCIETNDFLYEMYFEILIVYKINFLSDLVRHRAIIYTGWSFSPPTTNLQAAKLF